MGQVDGTLKYAMIIAFEIVLVVTIVFVNKWRFHQV